MVGTAATLTLIWPPSSPGYDVLRFSFLLDNGQRVDGVISYNLSIISQHTYTPVHHKISVCSLCVCVHCCIVVEQIHMVTRLWHISLCVCVCV